MLNLSRAVCIVLVTMALAGGTLANIAQAATPAAPAAQTDDARKQIESWASTLGITPEKISYVGLDGKPITPEAFYQELHRTPGQRWELNSKVSNKADAANTIVVKLVSKSK